MHTESHEPAPKTWQTSTLASEVGFLLARSNALSLATSNRALHDSGLKVRSYPILALVCDGFTPTQRELAELLRLDPSQIVALVDDLEGRGLLERQVDERDRRAKVLVATPAGHELYRSAQAIVSAAEKDTLKNLNDEEQRQLAALLHRIAFDNPEGAR